MDASCTFLFKFLPYLDFLFSSFYDKVNKDYNNLTVTICIEFFHGVN